MVNYQDGKIYKIVDNTNGNVYIGSTCKKLCQRIAQHRQDYHKYLNGKHRFMTSFTILENNNYDIILMEDVKDCENVEQLRAIERDYIESIECVNKNIPGRTKQEYNILYYENNKTILDKKNKDYYENNKVKIKECMKKYNEEHKEHLKALKSIRIICQSCNCEIRKGDKPKHERTQKHLNNMNK